MKYEFMKQHKNEFSIERMSKVFNVSRSGYYHSINAIPSERAKENERLLEKIKLIHNDSRQTYGSPRIHAELRHKVKHCSRKLVANLMQQKDLQAKMKKRFKRTTRVNYKAKVAPNLLQQDFTANNLINVGLRILHMLLLQKVGYTLLLSWIYFLARIVGLAMSERITTDLVLTALQQAIIHREPAGNLTHHSDRGCQYTSNDFRQLLKKHGIIASMSGTGNCYDNAAMESFFHTLKTEHIYFEHYSTREQAKQSIFEYVEVFYNRKRRHSTLGYISPMDF